MTHRILVVEDQEDLREIARFALQGAGYEVIEVATGVEGVAKAETEHPDLALALRRSAMRLSASARNLHPSAPVGGRQLSYQ
jgi:CheY-like chemotaxis protein